MSFPATQQGWYQVSNRDRTQQDQFYVSGPFLVSVISTNGTLQFPHPDSGQMVTIERRACFDPSVEIRARSIVTDVATNEAFIVVFVREWQGFTEAYLVSQRAS